MRLPPIDGRQAEWPGSAIADWVKLKNKVARLESAAGKSDAFERMTHRFREMARTGRFDGLASLLKLRMAARALTALWATDREYGLRLFNNRMLDALVDAQQPRLTRLTLVQLLQLYFGLFDDLDRYGKESDSSLREALQHHIQNQLVKLPERRCQSLRKDILSVLQEYPWLLTEDAPLRLVQTSRDEGRDFQDAISHYGLEGFDSGRYGDICRAHYYLEALRSLSPGDHDPVLDELVNPVVSKAPYQGKKRIGHAALEILIDRVADEPGEVWQNFIISLAGDPRIASSASAYREWWQPLGEERIAKVRKWLSREDLRLFLQAVEQYGIESDNDDLQRMFPARKLFLEGLFELKLIRNTRLLLGHRAEQSVRRILDKDVLTSFATMDGTMTDKAVIYLDCGDFYIVEGSHSFKIWVYLAQPSETLTSYKRTTFSHSDLTSRVPADYRRSYPSLPYDAFVHTPNSWQHKVFTFLADNGIELDMEQLMAAADYKNQLQRFGVPTVSSNRTKVPAPQIREGGGPAPARPLRQASWGDPVSEKKALYGAAPDAPGSLRASNFLSKPEKTAAIPDEAPAATSVDFSRKAGVVSIPKRRSQKRTARFENEAVGKSADLSSLPPVDAAILQYYFDNPGDRPLYAATILGIEVREINSALTGRLKLFVHRVGYGWGVNEFVKSALQSLDRQERSRIQEGDTPAQKTSRGSPEHLDTQERKVLDYFSSKPGGSLRFAAHILKVDVQLLEALLRGPLSQYVEQDATYGWRLTAEGKHYSQMLADPKVTSGSSPDLVDRIAGLTNTARRLLRRLSPETGERLSLLAQEIGVRTLDIEMIIKGSLQGLCLEQSGDIWAITPEAKAALDAYGQQESS